MYATANTRALQYRPSSGIRRRWGVRGIGATSTQTITTLAGAGASATLSTLVAIGTIAGPLGAAIGGAVGAVITLINTLFQPNYNKIAASNDANEIEPYLRENLNNWLSLSPSQKTVSVQQAALIVAQGWLQKLQQLCQQVPGSAGQNCISQRIPGGCGFHVAQPYGWINGQFVQSGPNDPSGAYCWDWGYYVDGIANDPNVVPDPGASSTTVSGSGVPTAGVLIGGTLAPNPSATGPVASATSAVNLSALSSVPWYVWLLGLGAAAWAVSR